MMSAPFSPQPNFQPMQYSYTQSINPPMNQTINQPMNQQISQPINQPMNQSMSQPMSQSMNQPLSQTLNQSLKSGISVQPQTSSMSYYSTSQPMFVQQYMNQSLDQTNNQTISQTPNMQYPMLQHSMQSFNGSQLPLYPQTALSQPMTPQQLNYAFMQEEEQRRTRRIKSNHAVRVLKAQFAQNPKPTKEVMRSWQAETGCSYTEICRWFRNERHKQKKTPQQQSNDQSNDQQTNSQSNNQQNNNSTSSNKSSDSGSVRHSSPTAVSNMEAPASPSSCCSLNSASTHSSLHLSDSSNQSNKQSSSQTNNQSKSPSNNQSVKPQISEWIAQFQQDFSFDQQQHALAALLQKQHAASHMQSAHQEHELPHAPQVM